MAWWHWALAVGALVVVAIVAAFALGLFGAGGPPIGKEIARHTHEGRAYVLVEYGDRLAIFSASSGEPVTRRDLAEDILRSYAWSQAIDDFDDGKLADVSEKVRRLDDGVSGVRRFSNEVVDIFDRLDGMSAKVPFVGSISAMDVVRESYPGVGEAEDLVRALDSELNALGDNSASLARASDRIRALEPSSVSGDEMDTLFGGGSEAARDLASSVGEVEGYVSDAREAVGDLAGALRSGSDTPIIGDTLGGFARTAGRFESELSGLSDLLGGFESELGSLAEEMEDTRDSANDASQDYVKRWLAEPYDGEWPPADPERRPAGAAPRPAAEEQRPPAAAPTAAPAPDGSRLPFQLEWATSASGVEAGESFTLTVRMHGVREAGEHGGISVSFPSLTQSGGSKERHSSSIADVEAVDYTGGLSRVVFHQPGASIYHREGNRQFAAEYLMVESDDPSWSTSDDRTLVLRITPKAAGEFPIQVRGWLCRDGYTDCGRNPSEGSSTDQQGWVVEVETVSVAASSAGPAPAATAPAATPTVSVGSQTPFDLAWEVSESSVEAGQGFILAVHMYGARQAGEHGGLSVSFPSLTQSGGSKERHSSSIADVEAVDYTGGLSRVVFHQPGASIYHREGNRQFAAEYLMVESDDPSWSTSDDRTLVLRITPKAAGEFPIQVRGWLCRDGYTDCGRNPSEGSSTDQQGWFVEVETVSVAAPSAATPAPPVGEFASVSAGGWHTCGLSPDGSVACWGDNDLGQSTPPGGEFASVSVGYRHTCGLRPDGSVACWGDNGYGESTPPGGEFASVSAGSGHTCGLRPDGTVACWGWNQYGQSTPPGGEFASVNVGGIHTCGLRRDGTVVCWGNNFYGESTPPGGEFASVSMGHHHTCGLRPEGSVTCWGWDESGQSTPPGGEFASIGAGAFYTCGLRPDGSVACWGSDGSGQSTPPGGEFVSVSGGVAHTCGLRSDGSVACWGENEDGQSTPPVGGAAPAVQPPVSADAQAPFELEWATSASGVEAGESFTLTVRMHGVREAGEHGGISVSFPSLTQPGGSDSRHSSSIADVEAVDYTSGTSRVAFHQPGASIYHRQGNRQFAAEYLMVESDDPSWSTSDDRTLVLRITPKAAGEFPIQVRGWLCRDGYTDCGRNPSEGSAADQQGWFVDVDTVSVAASSAAPAPTTTPASASGRIAFASRRDGDREIYVMNADGSGVTRLTDNDASDGPPSWSPDGQRIAFASDRDGDNEIYVMNADGSGVTRLTDNDAADWFPRWSPDGQRIAFVSDRDGKFEIYVMNADGSGVTRLTDNDGRDVYPSWSPDGQRIAFMSDRDGNFEIYVMNADGSGVTRLADNDADDGRPSWSPDGRRIAFESGRDGNFEIYVMNPDGSDVTRLTDNDASDRYPSWSPDGGRIAFHSSRDGNWEIYVMNADGSGVTRLTDNEANDLYPSWSPGPAAAPTEAPTDSGTSPGTAQVPFELEWATSASGVEAGESFTLTVRMHGARQAGEHGGISVSFPSLTQSGGSKERHSSSIADVEALDYTGGLSRVAFHQPGASIYHRQGNRQFAAEYLMVESDDPSWSTSDDRTLVLRITPKMAGEFPIQVRGWLCQDGYTDCGRNPSEGSATDQQGWVVDVETVSVAASSAAPAPTTTPASASGRIAFASRRDGDFEIYVMNADGSGVTRLTDNDASDGTPSWSPDGRRIAFHSDRDGNTEIYVMNADGSGVTRLTENDASDGAPSWSPDGQRIAFHSDRDGNWEIYVMNADGSGVTRLTDNDASDGTPSWSPDGQRIAFQSDRDGNWEIYVMTPDGSGVTRLTDNDADDAAPSWSPDGQRIAFASDRDGDVEIYVMNTDGSDVTRLTDNDADDGRQSWSPDGEEIAFISDRDGNWEIYVMNADGSGVTRLTDNEANDWHPSWSPGPAAAPTEAPTDSGTSPGTAQAPFELEWATSASGVEAGESFTLTVRMHGVREAGEHGGISVSFPSLTQSGGSKERHSSSIADVEAVDYTSGLSRVVFHQPGASIYHREGNRQFAAEYLMVESDDPSWSTSDDRTLVLRITPKAAGEFPIQIRGWLCRDGYTDCGRNPSEGSSTDQQGWVVEQITVSVAASSAAPAPTTTPASASGRIAFDSRRDGNREIYAMNADGSGVTRLTDNDASDTFPRWSPDGQRIAFDSRRDGNWEIYVMNADGSGVTRLTDNDAGDGYPSWSPDGQRIAFMSDRDGNLEIYVMNADGSGVTRLTDNEANDGVPSWSPDGRRIAFRSYRDGNFEIYVMNADGSGVTRLTDNDADDGRPSWSPDGRRIAFESGRDGNWEIYVMNPDGSDVTRLTDNDASDRYPSWSPDGGRIAFHSSRDGNWEIYVMNADGSGVTRLTDNEANDLYPSWSPGTTGTPPGTAQAPTPRDRAVLAAIYDATNGPNWTNNDNWLSDKPIGEWHGVTTDASGRVVELRLHENRLTGEIPAELGSLDKLQKLFLGANDIRGGIPSELGNLTSLRELWLGDGLGLTGELPPELSKLTLLEVIDLGYSDISGPLPAWLGDLTRLRRLYLDGNEFSGEVPAELGNLTRLRLLTFHGNPVLFGALPQALTKITGLDWLTFHDTGLCAPLDESFQAWLRSIPEYQGPDCLPPASGRIAFSSDRDRDWRYT